MTSSRQVAHIQMFSQFPVCACAYVYACMYCLTHPELVTSLLSPQHHHWSSLHHNDLYRPRPRHICGSLPPSLSLSLSFFLSLFFLSLSFCIPHTNTQIYTTCPYFSCLSFIPYIFFTPTLFSLSWTFLIASSSSSKCSPALVHSTITGGEKKSAWFTLQGLNACLTWHLSAMITNTSFNVSKLEKVVAVAHGRA